MNNCLPFVTRSWLFIYVKMTHCSSTEFVSPSRPENDRTKKQRQANSLISSPWSLLSMQWERIRARHRPLLLLVACFVTWLTPNTYLHKSYPCLGSYQRKPTRMNEWFLYQIFVPISFIILFRYGFKCYVMGVIRRSQGRSGSFRKINSIEEIYFFTVSLMYFTLNFC